MRLNDLLGHILDRVDLVAAEAHVFTADEVAGWPREALDFFINQGLLSPTTPAHSLECDGCEERCFMPVAFTPAAPPKNTGPYIVCNQRDDIGRVAIAADRLKRWRVDLGRLAGVLSTLLEIDQTPRELIRHRLWDLGKVNLASGLSEAFLARGLDWTDAEQTFGKNREVKESMAPLFFTPGKRSNGVFAHASVFPLSRMLRVQKDQLVLDREGIARTIAAKLQADTIIGNVFRKEGQYWTIVFEGNTFRLKNIKGLQYLAFLLAHPGQEFPAHEILSGVDGKAMMLGYSVASKMREQHLVEDGLKVSSLGDAGPLLDSQAVREYRRELQELGEELEEARDFNDLARAEALEDKIEAIKKELTAAIGLKGRIRKGADPNERARKTLSKAVGRALVHIQKYDLDLWRHLQKALDLGLTASYNPHALVNWIT